MLGKIIDWKVRGCCIKFYLGYPGEEHYHGDDWDDAPYECNAGSVYEEYVMGYAYHYYSFDSIILEPNYNTENSSYCKNDFIAKKVPCVILVEDDELWEKHKYDYSYEDWAKCKNKGIKKFYFGDELQVGTYFKNDKQTGMFIL